MLFLIYVAATLVIFIVFLCIDWSYILINFIYILGEYICELETYGDPIHQVNKLHVLGTIFS